MPVCDPFKQDFRQYLIQDFYENFDLFSGDTLFIAIGRPNDWLSVTGNNSDLFPPKSIDSVKSDTDFWRTALAFKKIQKKDVSLVIKRYDWEPNKIYDCYRDDVDLYDDVEPAKFYVLVDEERVYKCIDNNYNAVSTEVPTHTDHQIRILSDGYRWKFMYSIPPSKRKFLTKNQANSPGYMPVEYVDELFENDERELQYEVQNAAIDGSIDFIHLNQSLRNNVISDKVLFYDTSNQVFSTTGPGATSVIVSGSNLIYQNDYYNNMTIYFESGSGSGQQRRILDYINNANSTATVVLSSALNYGVSAGAQPTTFSIMPSAVVVGDGQDNYDILNTSATAAEIMVSFLAAATGSTDTSCPCDYLSGRLLDRFELSNRGKNYTYATINILAGLTFASGTTGDISKLARAIMSPIGGHGSNAVSELGASTLMIVTEFDSTEDCKVFTENDFRQFSLIKNPLLKNKQIRLNLLGAGLTNSFVTGSNVTQSLTGAGGVTGYTPASGKVLSWRKGAVGTTGTSELIITNITGGTFALGGFIGGVTTQEIVRIKEKTVAGTEYRMLKRLKLTPPSGITAYSLYSSQDGFVNNYIAFGKSSTANNVSGSDANGRIYRWESELGAKTIGYLYLEDVNGNFKDYEQIYQMRPDYGGVTGSLGTIVDIQDYEETDQLVYDQTIRLQLNYDGNQGFTGNSFEIDTVVGNTHASGYVIDWTPATGSTVGYLRLLPTDGIFVTSQNLIYTNSGTTGAEIVSILSEPELKYRSGTVLHLQNLRPIQRSPEQKEEIKLIVEF